MLLPHCTVRNNGTEQWNVTTSTGCNDKALHTLINNLKIICSTQWLYEPFTKSLEPNSKERS
nr:hypothetical protein Q903MT_gene3217 [Picea sitchensis]